MKELCVRALYVKELCVNLLCGMCGEGQLRQDHRERSWQLLVLAAKELLPTDCSADECSVGVCSGSGSSCCCSA